MFDIKYPSQFAAAIIRQFAHVRFVMLFYNLQLIFGWFVSRVQLDSEL